MIYEVTINYTKFDEEKQTEKSVKENFIVNEAESFSDAEQQAYEYCKAFNDAEVVAIKQSKIKEIANERSNQDDSVWLAEMQDVFIDDAGNEKPIKYRVLFFSTTYESANAFITDYAKQGYDMQLVSLKLTKFAEVIY
ncbi:MAG: DUF4494 family protein [Bacteroidales bacterium]|nr:DUF4494 family protein [Bacteroidales bacterium]